MEDEPGRLSLSDSQSVQDSLSDSSSMAARRRGAGGLSGGENEADLRIRESSVRVRPLVLLVLLPQLGCFVKLDMAADMLRALRSGGRQRISGYGDLGEGFLDNPVPTSGQGEPVLGQTTSIKMAGVTLEWLYI